MRIKLLLQQLFVVLVIVFFSTDALCQQTTSPPTWFSTPPKVKGKISAIGIGETKLDAGIDALIELATMINPETTFRQEGKESTSKSITVQRIGNVQVSSFFTDLKDEVESNLVSRITTRVSKINLAKGIDTLEVTSYYEDFEGGDTGTSLSTILKIRGKNLTFNDLLRELRRAGVEIKSQEGDEEYFVLFQYPEPKK